MKGLFNSVSPGGMFAKEREKGRRKRKTSVEWEGTQTRYGQTTQLGDSGNTHTTSTQTCLQPQVIDLFKITIRKVRVSLEIPSPDLFVTQCAK